MILNAFIVHIRKTILSLVLIVSFLVILLLPVTLNFWRALF